jgi:hypothetical protein
MPQVDRLSLHLVPDTEGRVIEDIKGFKDGKRVLV